MRIDRAIVSTPVGPMLALASADALCALEFQSEGRLSRLHTRLSRYYPDAVVADGWNDVLAATRGWLDRYFDGSSADHAEVPLDARGTAFERSVWSALRTIEPGSTSSYGEVARQIGAPSASRAVGLANGANPVAIVVPCHRVIGASGTLVGYGGGLDRKAWLLTHEQRHWPSPEPRPRAVPRRRDQADPPNRLPFER
ncbi:MAG: methylated-DNA--[protein]-cysteine S-methyltransferase [Vicinamibacterales bacterium]